MRSVRGEAERRRRRRGRRGDRFETIRRGEGESRRMKRAGRLNWGAPYLYYANIVTCVGVENSRRNLN